MKKCIIFVLIIFISSITFGETLDIHKVIEIGLENSYDMSYQNYNLQTSKQSLYSSYFTLLPSAQYSISKTDTKDSSMKTGGISFSESISSNDWRYFDIKKSISILRKKKIDFQYNRNQIIYDIIYAYLNVLRNIQLLELARQQVEISKRDLEGTEILFSFGKSSTLDLQNVKINLLKAQVDSLEKRDNLEKSKMDLCFMINIEYDENYTFKEFEYDFIEPDDFVFSEENNLEIVSEIENLKQAKINYNKNKLEFIPYLEFSINKSLDWNKGNIFDFDNSSSPTNYKLSLNYPIFSLLTNYPRNRTSNYSLEIQKLSLEQTKQKKKHEFDFLLTDFKQSKEILKLTEKQEALERVRFDLVTEQYRLGLVDINGLEKSRTGLFEKTQNRINKHFDLILRQEQLNLICNNKILKKY